MNKLNPLFFVVLALVFAVSGCGGSKTPPTDASLGDTWRKRPADKMVMVYVPEGEFEMGSTELGEYTKPVHEVALDGFWIDRTEVTNAQYQRCVEAGECDPPQGETQLGGEEYYGQSAYDDYPVSCATWPQAGAYCTWAGARLPTEAEWEYAARGPESFRYPWGDSEPNETLLNYDGNVGDFKEVGTYPEGASWCGALDMAGNTPEWVADWFGNYPAERQVNPTGPAHSRATVLIKLARGGSFADSSLFVRAAFRMLVSDEGGFTYGFGFRCAKDAE